MPNGPKDKELDAFLSKVDEIESLIKGLSSKDDEKVIESIKESDKYIEKLTNEPDIDMDNLKIKTGVNRTFINKSESSEPPISNEQARFMQIMEQDANERAQRKHENKRKAELLKQKGNTEFSQKNFQKAIEYYTEGINLVKDFEELYTNRAQAYMKLEDYNNVLIDCDWALRVNEGSIKALIHKGKALTHLKRFDEALKVFKEAKKIKKSSAIDEYIKETERCREIMNQK